MRKKEKVIEYDYEHEINQSLESINEWFIKEMLKSRVKCVYALKEIKAGEQLEVEIYPQFTRQTLPEGWKLKKKNPKAQRNLNDKNARTYLERLILTNFNNNDLWVTLTYDNEHIPPEGDMDRAEKNVTNFIKRLNRYRKKKGLKNARYIYVTEYKPYGEVRWHHHLIMDGELPGSEVESIWDGGGRNNVKRLVKDENGLSGMANYIVKGNDKIKGEKRWKSSRGLKKPKEKVVHSKKVVNNSVAGQANGNGAGADAGKQRYKKIGKILNTLIKDNNEIGRHMKAWYPNYKMLKFEIKYNEFNGYYYIHTKLWQMEEDPMAAVPEHPAGRKATRKEE